MAESHYDVAIVGGGACGFAVLIQMVERASAGTRVIILEKQSKIGPGLAYSSACVGTRVNMHAKSMSLYANDTDHFARWLKKNPSNTPISSGGDEFPPREHFGKYMNDTMEKVKQQAKDRDVRITIRQTEVIDMEKSQGLWSISSADGTVVQAPNVALCPGNHMSQIYKYLNNKPLYFPSPWPNSRLTNEIPKTASVAILGSRLTAIDEALYLTDRGYTGKIYLLSRTGMLPKVQAVASKRHDRVFAMYNLARELEENPRGAIITIVRRLHEEILAAKLRDQPQKSSQKPTENPSWVQSLPSTTPPDDITSAFKHDVESARKGDVPGQAILRETAFVIERYWKCLDEYSRETFMKEYMSTWVIHRHAMPLRTGERLLKLLEKGQLKVMRIDTKRKVNATEPGFDIPVISPDETNIQVDALIEATGIEYDARRIEAPLMKNLLAKNILVSNPSGGVNVDHQTMEVDNQEGLYVLGSMTRGIHFYSTAIDRNVPHAERLSDSILKVPARKPLHVALFVGTDIYSNLIAGQLIPRFIAAGHVPFIYPLATDEQSAQTSPSTPFELRELGFFENTLLQNTITPYLLSSKSTAPARHLTLPQLAARHGLLYHSPLSPSTLTSSAFEHSLATNHIDLGYVLTSSLPSSLPIPTSHFQPRLGLYNLHTSALANPKHSFGFSLQSSTGSVVDVRTRETLVNDPSNLAMLNYLSSLWDLGVEMLADWTDKSARGLQSTAPQTSEEVIKRADDLSVYQERGLRLVEPQGMRSLLVQAFAPEDEREQLAAVVEKASRVWYKEARAPEMEKMPGVVSVSGGSSSAVSVRSDSSSSVDMEEMETEAKQQRELKQGLGRRLSALGQSWLASRRKEVESLPQSQRVV